MTINDLIALNSAGLFIGLVGIGKIIYSLGRFTQKFEDHIEKDNLINEGINTRLKTIEKKI